jgi:hypothetical protein
VDGDNNLYAGNVGGASESNTIRIGDTAHTRVFLERVRGVTTGVGDAIPVVIDPAGQLGTVSSSRRHKEDIREMGDASARLKELRPVTFRYRGQPQGPMQFGLIAEEVAQVLPELVVRDAAGDPETVLYHEMPAMLVNELQRLQRILAEQEATSLAQQEEIARQDEEALAEQATLDELLAKVAALKARQTAAPSP